MTRVSIDFPFGGRSDRHAHHKQAGLTTRDAKNMRARDPVTGRVVGGQRSGFSKLFATQINASGLGHDICSFSWDSGKTTYARKTAGAPTEEWFKQAPDIVLLDENNVDVDRQSNAYYTYSNSGILKRNSAGDLIWKISLPVGDPAHKVHALHVDIAFRVYAGVTEGGDQATADLWCYEQVEDINEVETQEILWTIRTGFYFEEVQVAQALLYTLQNDVASAKSYVIVYGAIDSAAPVELLRVPVAFPGRGLSVLDDGAFYVASPEDESDATTAQTVMYNRGVHPSFPAYRPSIVGSDFEDLLTSYDLRKWSEYNPSLLTAAFTAGGTLDEGEVISVLPDLSGGGRDLLATFQGVPNIANAPDGGPLLTRKVVNGFITAEFLGHDPAVAGGQGLYIASDATPTTLNRKNQRAMWPGHAEIAAEAGAYVTFILLQLPPTGNRAVIMGQTDSGANHRVLWSQSDSTPAQVSGDIWWDPGTTDAAHPGAGIGGTPLDPLHYDYSSDSHGTDCVLVTIIDDCGLNFATASPAASKTRSLLRINGHPVDRWGNNDMVTSPTFLSHIGCDNVGTADGFVGQFVYMLTLQRIDPTSAVEPLLIGHEEYPDAGASGTQTVNDVTEVEGRIMHYFGLEHLLPENSDTYPHPYGPKVLGSIKTAFAPGATDAQKEIVKNFPCVAKYDRSGNLKWVFNSTTSTESAADLGGVGLGVRAKEFEDEDAIEVYCTGQHTHTNEASGQVVLRKLIDDGDDFSDASGDDAWHHKIQGNNNTLAVRSRMDVDEYGRLYFPYPSSLSTDTYTIQVFERAGSAGNAVSITYWAETPINAGDGHAVHHDPAIPDYGDGQTINLAEFVYVAKTAVFGGGLSSAAAVRLGLVTVTQATGNPRQLVHLVAADGDIKTFTVAGTVATPTGGSAALASASEFIMCVPTLGEAIFFDGLTYKVYTARTGLVTDLESTSSGAIVKRGRIAAFWRNRLVIGHFPENPGGWAMSAMGDIRNWDFFPPVVKSTSAILGNLARAKETPDILTGLIPMNEDLLLMGGYRSIWRMSGDPQDGGQMDRLSDSIGMAYGKAWAKDPEGRTFFFGLNPPGLYSVTTAGEVVNLTRNTLEDTEFDTIDFGARNIRLYWDAKERGIRILQTTRATLGTLVNHWFWEEKTADIVQMPPIWTDTFGASAVQPIAAGQLEGEDATGRQFVVLGEDGYIRKVDSAQDDDDGTATDAYFVTQIFAQDAGVEVMLTEARITLQKGTSHLGADLELFAGDSSEDIGPVLQSVRLGPGANDSFRKRVRGENIWARIRNSYSGERFAYSSGWVELQGAQIQRKG